jgi:uncharacterized protein YqfA (UPF0365 family)
MIVSIAIDSNVAQDKPSAALTVLVLVMVLIVIIMTGVIIAFFRTWIRAYAAGVPISYGALIGMRLRKAPVKRIVSALIIARKAGADDVTLEELETHYHAGGDVTKVAEALARARAANMPLTFEHAAAINLDGRDVVAEVEEAKAGGSL